MKFIYFQDPIYGLIKLDRELEPFVASPFFQRLRSIKQLGILDVIYPFANHSRYEHSLGVAHLARIVGTTLRKTCSQMTARYLVLLQIAALYHDAGHGPYSHVFDRLLATLAKTKGGSQGVVDESSDEDDDGQITHRSGKPDQDLKEKEKPNEEKKASRAPDYIVDHEDRSLTIVEIVMRGLQYPEEEIRIVQYLIDSNIYLAKYYTPPEIPGFLCHIVNNPIHKVDVDKLDYLARDTHYLRLDLAGNRKEIIEMLQRTRVIDDIWMFHIKDRTLVHDLICRRLILHLNRYSSPRVMALGCALEKIMEGIDAVCHIFDCTRLASIEDYSHFCGLTDRILFTALEDPNPLLADVQKAIKKLYVNDPQKETYTYVGDNIFQIENLDEAFAQVKWGVLTDASSPLNLLPKVRYYFNEKEVIEPNKPLFRLFQKVE